MKKTFDTLCGACERHPWRVALLLAVLAILVTASGIPHGFALDDHFFRAVFTGFRDFPGITASPLDLFGFASSDPVQNHIRMDNGLFPWWTSNHWQIAFWRPLTALTHWADRKLFGDTAWPMHLHSCLWYALLVWMTVTMYMRFFKPCWVAALAGLLFLLDPAHGMTIGWMANRNALIAAFFVAGVIFLHDRWRRDRWWPGLPLAGAALALALLSAEGGIAACAYLAAYAFFLDRGVWWRRLATLLPYAVIVVVWQTVYKSLGYGVAGSMLYIDPPHDPLRFGLNVAAYLPMLLGGQLLGGEPMLWNFLPAGPKAAVFMAALALLAALLWTLWPLLKRDATARFWAAGMVLALVPSCAVVPQSRLLVCSSFGGMGLIALFLSRWHAGDAALCEAPRRRMTAALASLWIFLHLAVPCVAMPLTNCGAAFAERTVEHELEAVPADPGMRDSTLIIVNAMLDLWGPNVLITRSSMGLPVPRHSRELCAGANDLDVERRDDRTLVLRPDNSFLDSPWTNAFRNPRQDPFHAGDRVALTEMSVEVTAVTPDGRPSEMVFHFERSLDDPALRWIVYRNGRYGPFTPPAVGQTVHIANQGILEAARTLISGATAAPSQ